MLLLLLAWPASPLPPPSDLNEQQQQPGRSKKILAEDEDDLRLRQQSLLGVPASQKEVTPDAVVVGDEDEEENVVGAGLKPLYSHPDCAADIEAALAVRQCTPIGERIKPTVSKHFLSAASILIGKYVALGGFL